MAARGREVNNSRYEGTDPKKPLINSLKRNIALSGINAPMGETQHRDQRADSDHQWHREFGLSPGFG
jgi:hypothetical protein